LALIFVETDSACYTEDEAVLKFGVTVLEPLLL
jgi:hypothetical protein